MSNKIREKKCSFDIGLGDLGEKLLAGFLVWCTFNYPMSEKMRMWFFVWAVSCSL